MLCFLCYRRVSEAEVKFLFLLLFFLGGLSTTANSEAVLPAYLIGLVIAGVFSHDKVLVPRIRTIAFALLTPFFFIKAGTLISLPAMLIRKGRCDLATAVIAPLTLLKRMDDGIPSPIRLTTGIHRRKVATKRFGFNTRSMASTGPSATTSAACSASTAAPSPASTATPMAAKWSIPTSFAPLPKAIT